MKNKKRLCVPVANVPVSNEINDTYGEKDKSDNCFSDSDDFFDYEYLTDETDDEQTASCNPPKDYDEFDDDLDYEY